MAYAGLTAVLDPLTLTKHCGPTGAGGGLRPLYRNRNRTVKHPDTSDPAQEEGMSSTLDVTDSTFEQEVLNSDKPVLVDYWAEWCGPCKMTAPILDEVSDEYAEKLKVAKLNIDENPSTPPKYGVRGIPTLMLFKGGSVEATKVGALSKAQLQAFVEENL